MSTQMDQLRNTAMRDGLFNSLRRERGNSILMNESLIRKSLAKEPSPILMKFPEANKVNFGLRFSFLCF